jgi:hypothetical protein
MRTLNLVLAGVFALAAPSAASAAAPQWGLSVPQAAYNEGYERGVRAGNDDARRGDRYDFVDEGDYRKGDPGSRSQYGNRDRYRDSFRYGYQEGYRSGYGNYGGYGQYGNGQYGNGPFGNGRSGGGPWYDGRSNRYDLAYQTGMNDGYEAGLDDGRDNRRFDPVSDRRFRNADRGYQREYGPKEVYKANYRDAFRTGYQRGYNDGRRYDRRPGWGGIFGNRF